MGDTYIFGDSSHFEGNDSPQNKKQDMIMARIISLKLFCDYQMFHISLRTIVLSNMININEASIVLDESQFIMYVLFYY